MHGYLLKPRWALLDGTWIKSNAYSSLFPFRKVKNENTGVCNSALDHNKDFVSKITAKSSQPCSSLYSMLLTNTNILNFKTDSFVKRTSFNPSFVICYFRDSKTNFPFSAHPGDKAIAFLFQYIYCNFSLALCNEWQMLPCLTSQCLSVSWFDEFVLHSAWSIAIDKCHRYVCSHVT